MRMTLFSFISRSDKPFDRKSGAAGLAGWSTCPECLVVAGKRVVIERLPEQPGRIITEKHQCLVGTKQIPMLKKRTRGRALMRTEPQAPTERAMFRFLDGDTNGYSRRGAPRCRHRLLAGRNFHDLKQAGCGQVTLQRIQLGPLITLAFCPRLI